MKRQIITTDDGSKTLYINELDETYHSKHGAIQEAKHVFIKNGLNNIYDCNINILELGLGTGLNVLVTIDELLRNDKNHVINYFSIEKYPITEEEFKILDYYKQFDNPTLKDIYHKIHESTWGEKIQITSNFYFTKLKADFFDLNEIELPEINLVYFDCFGAKAQPHLWEKPLFELVNNKMCEKSLLTTYSAKGSVKRILKELNFEVIKAPGPIGKREMITAWKKKNN